MYTLIIIHKDDPFDVDDLLSVHETFQQAADAYDAHLRVCYDEFFDDKYKADYPDEIIDPYESPIPFRPDEKKPHVMWSTDDETVAYICG